VTSQSAQNEFSGAAVVVVGGHLGIGPAVVRAFVERGANVVVGVLAQRNAQGAAEALPEMPGTTNIALDLGDGRSIQNFFAACESRLGGLAIVVMVAPPVKTRSALDTAEAEYRAVIDQELIGPILCLQEAGRRLVGHGGGRIISFCSMSGKAGVHKQVAPYAAAKGGLIMFSRVLAAELASTGVTVNMIATSLFDVQIAATPEAAAEVAKGIPVGRVGHSEEAAHAVLYLASPKGAYVTGETLNLSGGRFMD
jgi:3-oxoacyl-[acyl-carrier protein] reductase